MKQREPYSFVEYIFQFWMYPLGTAFLIGMFAAGLNVKGPVWINLLLFAGGAILSFLLVWLLKVFHNLGYNGAIYAHYLKRRNLKQSLTIEPTDSTEDSRE